MDESEILSRLLSHDERGLQAAQECYGARLTALARRIAGSETAEECVNDALLAAWNAIPPLRPRSLYAYLCRLTRNAALNRFAAQSAQKAARRRRSRSTSWQNVCPAATHRRMPLRPAHSARPFRTFCARSRRVQEMFFWHGISMRCPCARSPCGFPCWRTP